MLADILQQTRSQLIARELPFVVAQQTSRTLFIKLRQLIAVHRGIGLHWIVLCGLRGLCIRTGLCASPQGHAQHARDHGQQGKGRQNKSQCWCHGLPFNITVSPSTIVRHVRAVRH